MNKSNKQQHFTIFGLEVNMSSVLTTIVGFVAVTLLGTTISWVKDINTTLSQVKKEQDRVKVQYQPEIPK